MQYGAATPLQVFFLMLALFGTDQFSIQINNNQKEVVILNSL